MKKRILGLFLTLLMVLSLMPVSASADEAAWKSFYVSPTGSDSAAGTRSAPFKTLTRAQEEVRKYNQNMQGNIEVNLLPGRYEIMDHLVFTLEDSATNGYRIIWQGTDPDNIPTISGAKEVTGTWTEGEDGIWHVQAEDFEFVREMFVNDRIATRARSSKKIWGNGYYTTQEKWNHPHLGEQETVYRGIYIDKTKMDLYENPEDVEIHSIMKFRTILFHVDDIIQDPENSQQVIAVMDDRFFNEYCAASDGKPQFMYNNAFIVENAYELLDEPGEFYFNKKTKTLSYIPREGEDLNNAEILIPKNEQLLYMHGGNVDNLIENITFRNIRFAHATNLELEENNIAGGQAEYHYSSYTPWRVGRAATLYDWVKGLEIESCVFFGLTGKAVHLRNGVFNSRIEGNVFADLGSDGVDASVANHDDDIPITGDEGPYDAAWHAPFASSYHYWASAYLIQALNTCRLRENDTTEGLGWYSNPLGSTSPEWVMIELERNYTLESFEFSFPGTATAEQRSNFEVLLSKDRDFKEYKTLATYTEPADFTEKLPIADGEEYRYIMLRKLDNGPFCLDAVWAWTYDRLESESMAPKDCVIANNYFTRCAQQKQGSYPIMLNYTSGFELLHNHINDAPYAGITVGWGWSSPNSTCYNNTVNYNRIENVMQYMDDGAGIYILGAQPGTEVKENFITNTVHDGNALYFDQGTSGVTASSNVSYGTDEWMNINTQRSGNSIKNAYTGDVNTFGLFGYDATKQLQSLGNGLVTLTNAGASVTIDMEMPTQFNITAPPEEATRIMAEAGICDEWLWIMERVPEEDVQRTVLYGPDSSDARQLISNNLSANKRVETDIAIAQVMLENGSFGTLPWQYAPEYKVELEYWLKAIDNNNARAGDFIIGHLEEQYALQAAIKNANASVQRLSYEDMITMCEELAKDTVNFTSADITAFEKKVAAICAANPESRGDKAVAGVALEKAYTDLLAKSKNPEVMAVLVRGAESRADAANKKITVTLPYDVDFAEIAAPTVITAPGSKLAVPVQDINFAKGSATIPVYSESNKTYTYWTAEFVYADDAAGSGQISIDPADWVGGNPNVEKSVVGGALTIEPWYQPTMNKKMMSGNVSLSLWAPRSDMLNGFDIIFSSQTTDLVTKGFEDKNSYYMLTLENQKLTLYKAKAGVPVSHIAAEDVYFNYGEFNEFDITVTEEHGLNRVTVYLEGMLVMDTLVDEPIGKTGYVGIQTKNMAVKVK